MPDLGFINDIDWGAPDETVDGNRVFSVRCRLPFSFNAVGQFSVIDKVTRDENRVFDDDADGIIVDPAATGDTGSDDEVELSDPLVAGIASSTSIDFFGTEMSLRALKAMAAQFITEGGVPYLPRHNNGLSGGIEWDGVIGRTIYAEVVPVDGDQLAKPHNPVETHFLLRVTTRLYRDEPKAQELIRRLARGEPIGQSIGGWFTQLQIVQNEEGDVERVIVQGVELDHLVATRAPANPDSNGLHSLRSTINDAAARHRAVTVWTHLESGQTVVTTPRIAAAVDAMHKRAIANNNEDPEWVERHILGVEDNGDGTISVRYATAADDEDDETRAGADADDASSREHEEGDYDAPKGSKVTASEDDEGRTAADASADMETAVLFDTDTRTAQDTGQPVTTGTDAQRSAVLDDDSPAADVQHAEEPAMPSELTLDAIRDLFQAETAPIMERLAALEGVDERTTTENLDNEDDAAVVAAEARATAAEARAIAAEKSVANIIAAGGAFRVGRAAVSPAFPSGPGAKSGYMGLVERTRAAAPTLAAVAERSVAMVAEDNAKTSTNDLEAVLRHLMMAAEADGILTPPTQRAAWQ